VYGIISGYIDYQGVLNVAMKLREQDIFLDIYDDPDFACTLNEKIHLF